MASNVTSKVLEEQRQIRRELLLQIAEEPAENAAEKEQRLILEAGSVYFPDVVVKGSMGSGSF